MENNSPIYLSFHSISLMQLTCNNIFRARPPRSPKIPQNISKKLLDIGQIRDILGQNVPMSFSTTRRRLTLRHQPQKISNFNKKNRK